MEIIHIIIIGVILFILILIYTKSQNKIETNKQPVLNNNSEEKLDFLDKNYEANKIKELQYLTSQNESNENDIKSSDLF